MFERILAQNCQTFDYFNFVFSMSHHNAHYQSYKNAPTDMTRTSSDRIFLAMTARSAGEPLADYLGSGLLAWLSSATGVFYSMLPFIAVLNIQGQVFYNRVHFHKQQIQILFTDESVFLKSSQYENAPGFLWYHLFVWAVFPLILS